MNALASPCLALVAGAWTAACNVTHVPIAAGAQQAPTPATINRRADAGCEAPGVRRAMAQQLFRDEEFLGYICEAAPCSVEQFLARLTFREVVLRHAPRASGCIVGPLHEAMTRIYGVFVLSVQPPNLALIYTGIDLSVDAASKKPGFKDLVGTEKLGSGTWVTHRYVWINRGYEFESTTEEVEP